MPHNEKGATPVRVAHSSSTLHRSALPPGQLNGGQDAEVADGQESVPMELFLEGEVERLQAALDHLSQALQDAESEKQTLIDQIAILATHGGPKVPELLQRVATLEAENRYLEEELAVLHDAERHPNQRNGANATPPNGGAPPNGTNGHGARHADPAEGGALARPVHGRTESQQRLELEFIAREDKMHMWVQFRTRELQRTAELLAEAKARSCEMSKLIQQLCSEAPPSRQHDAKGRGSPPPAHPPPVKGRASPTPAPAKGRGSSPIPAKGRASSPPAHPPPPASSVQTAPKRVAKAPIAHSAPQPNRAPVRTGPPAERAAPPPTKAAGLNGGQAKPPAPVPQLKLKSLTQKPGWV